MLYDFSVTDHGTLVAISPLTDTAREWIDENVVSEGWQWMGGSLFVEHRYAEDLVSGMVDAGLEYN
jgi:hypothetical protein